jgi:hypothetical protein
MNKPSAFIVVENGQTWLRTSAETEEAIRTGFIMETVPLYAAPPKREPLTPQQISVGNQSTLNVTRDAFKQGVKYAEKMHGITGGEDEN